MLDPIRQGGRSKLQRHIRKPAHRHFRFEPLESRRLLAAVLEATGVVGQAPYDQVAIHYPVGATLGDGRGTVSLNDGNLNDRLFDQSVALSEFEIGANPVSTRTADLDADGDLDLVTRSSRHLVIQKQETGGSFGSRSAHELDELIGESHCSDRIFGLGDVNGDGASELVIPCDGTFYVLERDGDGGYRNLQEPIEYPFYNGDYIKEADLNGDGYLDFVFATFQSAKHTTVLLNDGNGQLSVAPSSFSVDALVQLLELGDLDGDGKEDVVFALSNKDLSDLTDYEDQLWMQKGRGDGTFEPAEAIVSLDSRRSFVSADIVDLNRDGRADIVISDYYQYISVWYQEESGYRHQVVTMPDYVRSVRAVDVPGDSLPRLNVITQVTDDLPNSRLYTFQQTSAEVFLLRDMIDLPLSATALELGDFNNDERQDSLVSNEFSILVESDSTGGFDNAQTFPLGESLLTSDYLSRDFNEDGLDDLVFVHRNGDHLSILFGSDSKRQTQSFAIERIGLGGVFDLQSVAAFDFDGDQHLDLVARNQDSVVLLSGRGDGTFSEASVLLSDAASGFFVGDFSGDSLDDLVAVSLSAGAASFRGWWGSLSSVAARNDFQVSGDFVAYDFDAHTKKLLLLGQDGDVISVAVDPDDNTLVIEQLSSVVLVGEVWDFSAANLNGDAQPDFIIGYVVFESLLEIYRSNSEGGYQLDAIPEKVAFRELIVKDITNDGIDELTIYGSNSFRSTDSSVLYVADGAVQEERFEETRILLYADLDGDGNVDRISKSNQLNVSWGKPIEKGISAAEFSTVFRAQQNWVQVDIGGPTSELSYINVWFDFNRDGFFDANEQVVDAAEIDRSGTHRVDFSIPSNADLGRTWARIRLSQNPDLGPDGIALNGDVEDYQVTIAEDQLMEFGDAPTAEQSGFLTSYPTTAADTGARHLMGGPRFSQTAVYERDGTPSADALYEESVDQTNPLQIGPLVAGSTALIGFSVFGANGFMNAWIDTNRDGDWDDVGEQIVEGRPVTANEVDSVQFLVPAELSGQRTYLRARVSSDPDLGTNGLAPDGEVVDIAVDVQVNSGSVAPPTAVIGSTANGLTVDENERVDRFSIHLSARPQGGSTVRIDSDALSQILVSPSMLTFDSGNWRQPQFVTVAGVSDSVEEQELTTYLNITALDSDQAVTSSAQIGVRVIDMTPAPSLLARVELAAGETIQAGVEWIAEKPFAENGVFKRQIVRANDRVIISGDNLWQNPLNRFDVDLNGGTTALDALLVINEVARRDDIAGTDLQDPTPVQLDDFRFYDVSADGRISALDALQVINHLSRESIRSNVSVVNLYALPDQDSEDEKYRLTDEAVATLF